MYIGIVLAAIVGAFIIELLIAGLYPHVSVVKQHLEKASHLPQEKKIKRVQSRKDIKLDVHGTTVNAWLFLPEHVSSPVPCIIMAHGLGGIKNMGLDTYAVRFQEAGMAVLAFDYRHLGESEGQPRQLIWIPYQLQDYAAAIGYARGLKEIDPARIGLWGTSLSGGHAIVSASNDSRIACVTVQCPLLDGMESSELALKSVGLKHIFRMAGHGQRDLVRSWFGLSPHKIPLVGKPGTIALMADDGAWKAFNELAPDDFVNEACARIGIRMDKYRPISKINEVQCPLLIQSCDYDSTLPFNIVEKAVRILGSKAEVIRYPIGHFDIYLGDNFEKAVNDQIVFFKKHLLNIAPT